MIPGLNALKQAFHAIAQQRVTYYAQTGRHQNDVGMWVTEYAPPITIKVSVQPVKKNLYDQIGLDLQKSYVHMYSSNNTSDVERDKSGDQFDYAGKRYEVLSTTDWSAQDGWTKALCVQVPLVVNPKNE